MLCRPVDGPASADLLEVGTHRHREPGEGERDLLTEAVGHGRGREATVSGDDDDDVIQGPGGTAVAVGPYGTVDGGRGDSLCRTDNRDGGTVTNCQA
ncbi:hypothetical protein [Streptomyces sp. NPDC051162]|uniref:hypothetical protein n=1 Tax=unclassified Streptomyces TaxID=2593676 RepID=UPI00341746EA